ncbi:MAG: hypothetical protein OXC83_13120 [Chloroflexi bacterium]|nr:hypothetical protein [Chloroflexota bacterium]
MIRNLESLVRFRNAIGVMLAISAIFAVVLSTISTPGDRAFGQVADEDAMAIEDRAKAWWAKLDRDGRINILEGKEADAVDDVPNQMDTQGRQYDDGDDDTEHAVELALKDYDDLSDANKDEVKSWVDGAVADPGDIYAVGDHLTDVDQALRGFQSVELWWMYLSCQEARVAVGEDNDDLDFTTDQDGETAGFQAESSAVCDATLNTAGDAVESTSVKAYDSVKPLADEVGQAILGLDAPGSPSSTDNTSAKAWWNKLNATQMVDALYGDGADDGDPTRTPATDGSDPFTRPEKAQKMYDDLDDATKTLVNDRWQWIYNMGGANDDGLAEVVYWWNSIGCAAMLVAVGEDNDADTTNEYCAMWDGLNPSDSLSGEGQQRQARVLEVGQAILGTAKPVPQVADWWGTLDNDQRVNVVYGNPPMRAPWNHDDDDTTADESTPPTMVDKAVFQKPYDMLAGSIPAAGLQDGAATNTPLRGSDHLPAATVELLVRHNVTADVCSMPNDANGDPDPTCAKDRISAKSIVDAIAMELFDPPTGLPNGMSGDERTVVNDEDFDWPYNAMNKPANVADWWGSTDCRVMRLAVGQDNQYLNAAVVGVDNSSPADGDFTDDGDVAPEDAETSIYCRHFPGAAMAMEDDPDTEDVNESNILSEAAQMRVVTVGSALLGLSVSENKLHAARPSFNEPATGDPQIMGTAQVGAKLTVNTDQIDDKDDDPNDEGFEGSFIYQWLRNGEPIPGATSSSYVLTAADVGATVSVRVSFIDGELYPEMRTSPASLATSPIAGSPGEISKIEPSIRGVTVKAGGEVVLSVKAYGLQGAQDQKLSAGMGLEWKEDDRSFDDDDKKTPWEVTYTAPSSPSTYTITASFANDGDCRPLDKDGGEEMRDKLCTATFQVRVQRPSVPQPEEEAPVNPPGEIPGLIPDSDGNQYEVFTPVEGGTFDGGEGYSITVPSGAVPNGEYIGIRMSDDGAASNVGQTHQRYTLGGNMYGVHAVDGSGSAISSYVLDDPATVCIPLPASLRSNISHLSLAAINSDGSLTILAAQVRLNTDGDTMVCGNLSNLPSSVAVGSQGAPDAIPTATPMPEPELPVTGGSAPASSTRVLWSLLLGIAVLTLSSVLVIGRRRRENVRSNK